MHLVYATRVFRKRIAAFMVKEFTLCINLLMDVVFFGTHVVTSGTAQYSSLNQIALSYFLIIPVHGQTVNIFMTRSHDSRYYGVFFGKPVK
jgi:hypothetical protein